MQAGVSGSSSHPPPSGISRTVTCMLIIEKRFSTKKRSSVFGDLSGGETPGNIPNPEAKPVSADGTARGTSWESRSSPIYYLRAARLVGAALNCSLGFTIWPEEAFAIEMHHVRFFFRDPDFSLPSDISHEPAERPSGWKRCHEDQSRTGPREELLKV